MEIVVNTRLLLKNRLEGIGWFSYETLRRITTQHPEHHFIFLFDRPFSEEFIFSDNITPLILSPQARHPVLFYIWFEYSVAPLLGKLRPDLFLSPDGYLPLRTQTPCLPVMHDLNFEHYPQDLPFLVRKYYRHFFPKFAQKAKRIATVSETSRQDIIKTYQIPEEKIDIVYNGINESYGPVDQETKKQTRDTFSRSKEYFLFIGSLHPRKNIKRLLEAYEQFRTQTGQTVNLLIVGEKYWWNSEMESTYRSMKFRDDVIFCGWQGPENLRNIIASALALTYVPYFEGFGIPIVEAFACETPVITSGLSATKEIAADAAILCDPFSVDSIARSMIQVCTQEKLRKTLTDKGIERSKDFSWNKTAERLWKSIEKTTC